MKNPLYYQATEYDCGPTSMLNAISYLFEREEIPPIIIKTIMTYCLDQYNEQGEICKGGTSCMAMKHLSDWLNQYHKINKFPISCEYLSGDEVELKRGGRIIRSLENGGAVVLRVWYECGHYVLLTGADDRDVYLFDPYMRKVPFDTGGIEIVPNEPTRVNRKVAYDILNAEGNGYYEMGPKSTREAVIVYNLDCKKGESVQSNLEALHSKISTLI